MMKEEIKDLVYRFWKYILIVILLILLFNQCSDKNPKVITKTETKIETIYKIDTVRVVEISEPKKVYIEKPTKVVIKKDTVFIDKKKYNKEIDSVLANAYPVKLTSNKATFIGEVFTSGELYDIKGIIEYPETTITKNTKTIIKENNSGLFLYGQTNYHLNEFGAGLDWQIKNKIILGTSVTYNAQFKNLNLNFKAGFKVF